MNCTIMHGSTNIKSWQAKLQHISSHPETRSLPEIQVRIASKATNYQACHMLQQTKYRSIAKTSGYTTKYHFNPKVFIYTKQHNRRHADFLLSACLCQNPFRQQTLRKQPQQTVQAVNFRFSRQCSVNVDYISGCGHNVCELYCSCFRHLYCLHLNL